MSAEARVLVIEDDQSIRDRMVRMLTFEGFEVFQASNGSDGVSMARDLRPDLVICDLLMPEVNGFGACLVLRDDPLTSSIPTIVVSALNAQSDRERIKQLGVAAFLSKPFRNRDLIDTVRSCLITPEPKH